MKIADHPTSKHGDDRAARSRLSTALICAIALAAFIAFAPGLRNEFLNWDDDRNFLDNPDFRGLGPAQLRWAWSTYHLGVWQPLAWLLLGAQYLACQLRPLGYHITSAGIHALNGILVYILATTLLTRRDPSAPGNQSSVRICSALAAILFVAHPLRVEAVSWISCQPYLPAVACCLLAAIIHARSFPHPGPIRLSMHRWLAVFILFLAAICFKAVAVSLPVVLLIMDVWLLDRWKPGNRWRVLAEKLPFLCVAILVSLWAMAAKDYNDSRVPLREFDAVVRLAQSAWGTSFYLFKTLWPTGLLPYYRLPPDLSLSTPRFLAAAAFIILATAALFALRRRFPAILAAWLAYLVILLPNLGIIQIGQQLAADRYSYLAIIGPMILFAAGLHRLVSRHPQSRWPAALLTCALAALLTVQTWKQTAIWKNSETLWRTTIDADPDCAVAHCNLGEALLRKGEYPEASRQLSTAIDLDPQFCFAYANLGALLCQARKFEQAAVCGEHVLSIQPGLHGKDLARAHAMLGQAYAGLRRDELAWKHTRIAHQLGLAEASKMLDYLRTISKEPPPSAP